MVTPRGPSVKHPLKGPAVRAGSAQAKTYRAIADRIWEKVSEILAARETSMPKIVIQ